jgi:hypothetical protein
VFLGVEIQKHGRVELGYEYLPVKMPEIVYPDYYTGAKMKDEYDFGGVMIRAGYIF